MKEYRITDAFFSYPMKSQIDGETLHNDVYGDCRPQTRLPFDFVKNVLIPYYGCDSFDYCEIAANGGTLPGNVRVDFGCTTEQRNYFIQTCMDNLEKYCSK